jgi:hypothetical protein
MKWSEIQRSYPLFWTWLNAWLKSKGADDVQVLNYANSEYVKVRFSIPARVQELSSEMIHEALDESGIRVCISFDAENGKALWRYVIYKKGLNGLWTQIYSSGYVFNKISSVNEMGLMHGISEHNIHYKNKMP